jgi:hypothetical protein
LYIKLIPRTKRALPIPIRDLNKGGDIRASLINTVATAKPEFLNVTM